MDILGPFPDRRPDLKQPGWYEHIVVGTVQAVIYTRLTFDDPRVTRALEEYVRTAVDAGGPSPSITPHSAFAAVRLADSVRRARETREARRGQWQPSDEQPSKP